jgi:hypothetical protein
MRMKKKSDLTESSMHHLCSETKPQNVQVVGCSGESRVLSFVTWSLGGTEASIVDEGSVYIVCLN